MTAYCIDTSALVAGWRELYRPATFPGIWTNIEALIAAGTLISSEEVKVELKEKDDDLHEWARKHDAMFRSMNAAIHEAVERIVAVPKAVRTDSRHNWADPFVIAVALVEAATVISNEKPGGPGKPKIPYLCERFAVPCIRLEDFVNGQGWTFG